MAQSVIGLPAETVFVECRAFIFYYNANIRQWSDAGEPSVYSRVQLLCSRPPGSTGVYRILGRLESSGMITLNILLTSNIVYGVSDPTWHQIRIDPRTVYGLRMSPESDGVKFSIIVQNTLRSLQGNPGPAVNVGIPAGPPPTPMQAWGMHPNIPITTAPMPAASMQAAPMPAAPMPASMPVSMPVRRPAPDPPMNLDQRRSQRRRDQEAQIDNQCSALSTAVHTGNVSQATEIVKTMANQKLPLSIKLKNPVFVNMDPGEETISLKVVVEDKESSGGAFSIKVLPTATIERLQQEVFERYGFPIQVQKWIVGKKVPRPQDTLQELGVTQSGTTVFLYLLSGKSVGLRRSDAERLARGNAAHVNLPVITESNYVERAATVTTVTASQMRRATSTPSLATQSLSPVTTRAEPVIEFSPPPSMPMQRNVGGADAVQSSTMPQRIDEIRNMIGQQTGAGYQAVVNQLSQQGVVNNLIPTEQSATESDEPVGWQCPRCTLINPPTRPGCEACSEGRPANYVVPSGTHMDDRERSRIAEEQRLEALFQEAEERRTASVDLIPQRILLEGD